MIEVRPFTSQAIKKAYNLRSWIYSKTVARREHRYHLLAIERAKISPGEKILEVAIGSGMTLVELAKRTGQETTIYGTDISTGMLRLARERLQKAGFLNFDLREADCRKLPYFFGLCRPVLMEQTVEQAGFENVSRLYIDGVVGSEIVMGNKPSFLNQES